MVLKKCRICEDLWCPGPGGLRLCTNKALLNKKDVLERILGNYHEGDGKSPFICKICVKKIEDIDKCNKIIASAEASFKQKDELLKNLRKSVPAVQRRSPKKRVCSSPLKVWKTSPSKASLNRTAVDLYSPTKPKNPVILQFTKAFPRKNMHISSSIHKTTDKEMLTLWRCGWRHSNAQGDMRCGYTGHDIWGVWCKGKC